MGHLLTMGLCIKNLKVEQMQVREPHRLLDGT